MKINLTQPILDYENKEIKENDKIVDLRQIFIGALNNSVVGDDGRAEVILAEDKAKIYQLSVKLYEANEVDLTIDDRSFIKERVGKLYTPIVYGRVCEILEGDDKKDSD